MSDIEAQAAAEEGMTRAEKRVRIAVANAIENYKAATMCDAVLGPALVTEILAELFHTPTFVDVRDLMTEVVAEQAQREHIL